MATTCCGDGRFDIEYQQDPLTGQRIIIRIHEMTDAAGAPLNPPLVYQSGTAAFATALAAATACSGSKEFEILCDPVDKRPIKVVAEYNPISGEAIVTYFEIDGVTGYTGDPALLVDCEGYDYEIKRDLICDTGVTKIHEIIFSFDESLPDDTPGTLVSDLWFAVDGVTPSTAPIDPTMVTLGACPLAETICRSFC